MVSTNTAALEARARRAAKRVGLIALKSRRRRGTIDNLGGFQLIEPRSNKIVAGERLDLTVEDVVGLCRES